MISNEVKGGFSNTIWPGGRYEESDYHAIGSGGKDARNTMREHFKKAMAEPDALKLALLALYNAADDDVGTGGPDLVRGIYPTAKIVNANRHYRCGGITDPRFLRRDDRQPRCEGALTMPMPYYVSPEQMMQDKAEYAKKGIAKGRSIIAMEYVNGILLAADNPSASLHKISEIYDNIAFAGAGKYSEFENLRKAGIRHADLKGFMYSREDVTARSLANGYSQSLGTIFSQEMKPLEVEILVVQIGHNGHTNEMYRISFDGSIIDEKQFAVIGGKSEAVQAVLKEKVPARPPDLKTALNLCIVALEQTGNQKLSLESLEVAVLDRTRDNRKFRRYGPAETKQFLA